MLFVDLCYLHDNCMESEIEQRRKEIQGALQLFRYFERLVYLVSRLIICLEDL